MLIKITNFYLFAKYYNDMFRSKFKVIIEKMERDTIMIKKINILSKFVTLQKLIYLSTIYQNYSNNFQDAYYSISNLN